MGSKRKGTRYETVKLNSRPRRKDTEYETIRLDDGNGRVHCIIEVDVPVTPPGSKAEPANPPIVRREVVTDDNGRTHTRYDEADKAAAMQWYHYMQRAVNISRLCAARMLDVSADTLRGWEHQENKRIVAGMWDASPVSDPELARAMDKVRRALEACPQLRESFMGFVDGMSKLATQVAPVDTVRL